MGQTKKQIRKALLVSDQMRPLRELRLKILIILSDNKGYSHGEISRRLGGKNKKGTVPQKRKSEGYDRGNLTRALNSMINQKLIYLNNELYYIEPSEGTFSLIISQGPKGNSMEFQESILKSEYVNNLTRAIGFKSIFVALREHLIDKDFYNIAAPALLSHSATVDEFKTLPKSIEEFFASMENTGAIRKAGKEFLRDRASINQSSPAYRSRRMLEFYRSMESLDGVPYDNKIGEIDELEILRDLGIKGVRFYRENLLQDFVTLFSNRMANTEEGNPIIRYVKLDNYLSPYTAFPVNSPIEMIYSKSFGRLYEDVYLIDARDMGFLLDRANLVFEHFPEFSRDYIQSRANIEAAIRELVLNWNTACARFETIYYFLGELGYEPGISCFHLASEGTGFQIIDLKTDQRLLSESDMERLDPSNLNRGFYEFDQTQFMRPVLMEHLGPVSTPG